MPIHEFTAWVMLAALVIYTLSGGADYGAGVLDLLARGPRRQAQRDLIADAIGPIWEANHVWLIVIVVLLFTCFPAAFAAVMTALHVPVTLVLLGIVFRGTSFVFRSYTPPDRERARRLWGRTFAAASVITPVLLGVVLGAIATGDLRWEGGVYVSGFFRPWILNPFCWAVGVFTLAVYSFLAAVYLCVEAEREEVAEDFRRWALWGLGAVVVSGIVTWVMAQRWAPVLSAELSGHWWSIPLRLATALAAAACAWGLLTRRYAPARAAAVVQVALMVAGYGAALYPLLIVPDVSLADAAAPRRTHALVLTALAVGALVLLPSLYYLLRIFKGRRAFSVMGGVEG